MIEELMQYNKQSDCRTWHDIRVCTYSSDLKSETMGMLNWLSLMKQAMIWGIEPGLESLSEITLKRIIYSNTHLKKNFTDLFNIKI